MSGKIFAPKRRQSKLPLTTGDFTDPAKITRTGSHGGADSFKSTTAPTIMVLSSISDDVGNQSAPVQSPSMSSPQSPPPGFQIHQHDIRPRQPRLDVGHDLAPISLEQPEQNAIPYSPQNQQLNTRGSGFKMLEKAIRALHLGSKAIPQVQSAVEGFISCLDNFEASCRNREECEELVSELSAMADYLSRHLEDPRSQGLTKRILGIAETIDKEIEQVRKIQEKSKTTQVLRAKDHEEDLASRFRRIGNLFRRIQMEISMSEWSNTYDTLVSTYLDKLKPAMLAHYDSRISDAIGRRACTADTREETLTKIEEWCDDPTSPMIYWMNGMAGTGKTTIAYTLARKLESRGQLGASFFCTVTSKECRDAGSIVPTIAHQLSYRSTPFQAALVEVLKQHPNAATLTIPKQVERLLLDPLDAVGNNMAQNLVVIIDALDECHNSNVVGLILDSLFTSTGRLPIKFFITSRPEPGIYEKLAAQSNDLRSVLHLHEVCEDSIQRDIRRFLQEGLKLIHPSEDEIEKLTALSGRLFIFAATAVRYIVPESTPVDSRARLKIMLEVNSKSTKIHSDIDALYHAILSGATDNDNFKLEPEERENVLSVLWAVVCSLHPVSFVGLTVRAGLDGEAAVLAALAPLESVLHVSHTDDTISIFHASFPQFIFDQSRSNNFFCDIAIISRTTTLRCLRIINAQLPSSIEPDTAMSPYLNYAANNFSIPLVADGSALPGTEEICSELRNFFENRFESWLWLVTNHKGLGEHTHVELIRVLLGWLVMNAEALDLLKASQNAYIFVRCSDADRKLIRDTTERHHAVVLGGSTESSSNRSWIWRGIDRDIASRAWLRYDPMLLSGPKW